MLYDTGPLGEPAEYERVVWGEAVPPRLEINGERVPLPLDVYTCDGCDAAIPLGARACAVTIFLAGRTIPAWESDYVRAAR